jgi:hypothetical protein
MSQDYRPLITVVGSEVGTHTTPVDYKAGDTVQSERVAGLSPCRGDWSASIAGSGQPVPPSHSNQPNRLRSILWASGPKRSLLYTAQYEIAQPAARTENPTLSGSKPDGIATRPHLSTPLALHFLRHGGLRLGLPLSGDLRLDLDYVFPPRGPPYAPPLSGGQAPVVVLSSGGGHGSVARLPRVLLWPRARLESPLPRRRQRNLANCLLS